MRRPFELYESINYDQDSEEEYNDMTGEQCSDLGSEENHDDSDVQSLYEEGFIVSDDDGEFSETDYDENDNYTSALLRRRDNNRRLKNIRQAMV